ncbi:MAG: DUF1573 domain-containing protein [Bacteroidota bacterium]
MKKAYFFTLMIAVLGMFHSVQAQQANAQASSMKFENVKHNFGTIPQGTPVTTEFSFKNTGKTPVVISEVKTSCGCTTPFYTKDPVPPGKSGVIKASYNAAKAGDFNKSITVKTNAGDTVLFIKGSVVAKDQPAQSK